jgi:hypothetical protein
MIQNFFDLEPRIQDEKRVETLKVIESTYGVQAVQMIKTNYDWHTMCPDWIWNAVNCRLWNDNQQKGKSK